MRTTIEYFVHGYNIYVVLTIERISGMSCTALPMDSVVAYSKDVLQCAALYYL